MGEDLLAQGLCAHRGGLTNRGGRDAEDERKFFFAAAATKIEKL